MRLFCRLPLLCLLGLTACDRTQPVTMGGRDGGAPAVAQQNSTPAPDASGPAKHEASTASAGTGKESPTGPSRLLGILDPERERMVAFALKVPSDWQVKQSLQRRWEGAVGHPQVYLALRSPDGRSQIEYLPAVQYLYSEGPMTSSLRAKERSFGLPTQAAPNELALMPPTDYIKQILLPDLAQRGQVLSDVANEQTAPQRRDDSGQTKLRGSVDGTLPNGNRARVECRISVSSRRLGTDMYHTWSVVSSITQTAGELEPIHAHTRVVQDSIVPDPTWLKLEQEAMSRGMQANSDASRQQHEATMSQIRTSSEAMTRAHEQRMDDIRSFGEANTARFNDRMAQMDRDQRIRVDTIRGETRYADPTTGERVKVEDGFNHVYRNQQNPNIYYGTDTPIDAGKVDWQELQKVQFKDY